MKTTLCLIPLLASVAAGYTQDASYLFGSAGCSSALAYATPVVYHAPVVYQAPVAYYGPVYYMASVAAAGYSAYEPECARPPVSTVVHITGGRGVYTYSNYGGYDGYSDCGGSTVIHIGSGYSSRAVRPHYSRLGRWR